ncbi:MAG: sodium:proton exchanger [Brevinematales bacterium]|nr:sodium:proton exchanger [Brevinematales bacterium]
MIEYFFLISGAVLLCAFLVKLIFNRLRIPEVTGYVIIGILLGISMVRLLDERVLDSMEWISSIGLCLIAFLIGIELKWDNLKKLGKSIVFIVLFETMGAFIVVFFGMLLLSGGDVAFSLLLGAVASATAPAATVAVIRQFQAKGFLTSTILAVVGLDDAAALIVYVFAASFAKGIISGAGLNWGTIILSSFLSVGLSIVIGGGFGALYAFIMKHVRNNEAIVIAVSAFLLIQLGVCKVLGISELLTVMVFGAVTVNLSPALVLRTDEMVRNYTPIFLSSFFIIGGAHLDLSLITKVGLAGIGYFLFRTAGKIGGGTLGAVVGRAPANVKRYVGFALIPQVGVALALALAIRSDFGAPGMGEAGKILAVSVINILLLTTIITEIVGPLMTRAVLKKAGEIQTNI